MKKSEEQRRKWCAALWNPGYSSKILDREVAEIHVKIECQNILKLFRYAPFTCVDTDWSFGL
jgi:hypothetical protein